MVMAGRSVHLTTLFLGKLEEAVNLYFVHILSFVTTCNTNPMTVEIISRSISMKVWDRTGIQLATPGFTTPGSAARLAYVARHVTDYIFVTLRLTIIYSNDDHIGKL